MPHPDILGRDIAENLESALESFIISYAPLDVEAVLAQTD
jgi:hypothetical protein